MVTGDNLTTAVAVALEAGILQPAEPPATWGAAAPLPAAALKGGGKSFAPPRSHRITTRAGSQPAHRRLGCLSLRSPICSHVPPLVLLLPATAPPR
jgi:magnesium-transporting ATPase (P-type)